MPRIVVLGGYGAFGARVCERLAGEAGLELIVAGRSLGRAKAFAAALAPKVGARLAPAAMDAETITASELRQIQPLLLINASGPFQVQDYRVERACIDAGVHYADLADARDFVTGIGVLDAAARQAGVLVASGASTVPAISAAVVDELAPQFAALESVAIVVAPGNSFDPGMATTRSILGALGRPFPHSRTGAALAARGWQGLRRHHFPGLGGRWLGACDAPDRELFVLRYPGLRRVEVFAALEVGAMHLGLWGLSWLVRAGLVRNPERLAAPLLAAKRALRFMGSDVGGMAVVLEGTDQRGRRKRMQWSLVARRGHGPFIPATPSVILAKRLLAGTLPMRGAMPCLGLFTLADVMAEIADLDIEAQVL
jgi:saccharopine dehydrogenase-like NADP-dependent oxidoreductase